MNDGRSEQIAEFYKEFAKKWQGVYIITAADCGA
jgi:hypothetical protein